MGAKFLVLLTILCLSIHYSEEATDKVVCYFASWSIYRPDKGAYSPTDIDPTICTHINYAFLSINPDGTLALEDESADIDKGNFQEINGLKKINPNLKTIISIEGNASLSSIAASAELRNNLISSSFDYLEKYGFDGLDIHWEYPEAKDKDNFITLLSELKQAFEPKGYILSIAVSAMPIGDAYDAYDIPAMSDNVDIINLMTYDFHIASSGRAGENSPLYWGIGDSPWAQMFLNVNSTVVNWVNGGADSTKLTIGLAFYGHTFQLFDPNQHGLAAPVTDNGISGPYTKGVGTIGYNEICELTGDWTRVFEDQQKVPYKYKDKQWIGYDDPESIALKVQFAKENNVGGLMVWTVDTDDFLGLCGTKNGLLQAIKDNL